MKVFAGCYALANYPAAWGWIGVTLLITGILLAVVGLMALMES